MRIYHSKITDLCRDYGIKLNGANKSVCPFHKEKTASFTVYPKTNSYFCFGCGEGGDIINLYAKLENIDNKEAYKLMAEKPIQPSVEMKKEQNRLEMIEEYLNNAYYTLSYYHCKLYDAKKLFSDPLFYEALINLDKIEYYLKCLDENPSEFCKVYKGVVKDIENRCRCI